MKNIGIKSERVDSSLLIILTIFGIRKEINMDFVIDPRIIYGLYVFTMLRYTAVSMMMAGLIVTIVASIFSLDGYEEYEVNAKK